MHCGGGEGHVAVLLLFAAWMDMMVVDGILCKGLDFAVLFPLNSN